MQRALAADRYEREVPFSAVLDDGTHLVGRMDLVFLDAGELVVVDYKTDAVATAAEDSTPPPSSTPARPRRTRIATERATGLPVREVVFIYPRAGAERTLARDELGRPRSEPRWPSGVRRSDDERYGAVRAAGRSATHPSEGTSHSSPQRRDD